MELNEVISKKETLAKSIKDLISTFNEETGLVTCSCNLAYREFVGAGRVLTSVELTVEMP